MVHRFNIFLLSILLVLAQIFTMNQAMAANVGGWSMGNPVAQGASAVYTGTKNVIINGADYIKKGTAKITPTAAGVAKVLRGGVAGYALSIAVEQLIGSVDWVLDPANNQIVYVDPNNSNVPRLWRHTVNSNSNYFNSALEACNAGAALNPNIKYQGMQAKANYPSVPGVTNGCYASSKPSYSTEYSEHKFQFGLGSIANPNYVEGEDDKKTLSLDVVAAKVISNAESETDSEKKAAAQVATTAAAADIVAEAETDDVKARPIVQQLEESAETKPADEAAAEKANEATGTQTQNPTKPDTTDLTLEFPIFCNWAPSVCEAAQVVISFPQTLIDWWNIGKNKAESWAQSISEAWTATKEWMNKEDIPEEETAVEIDQTAPVVPNTSYFNWGAYCPFSPGTQTISLENTSAGIDYDLSSWCQLATDVRPFVLAAGALMSFLIAAGVVMGRDD